MDSNTDFKEIINEVTINPGEKEGTSVFPIIFTDNLGNINCGDFDLEISVGRVQTDDDVINPLRLTPDCSSCE